MTRRSGPAWIVVVALVDLAAAALVAVLVFRLFGAYSGADTNPPVCSNASGGEVSCSLTAPVLMVPAFVLTLLALVLWQTRRRRSAGRSFAPRQ